jgi:hypothetical protein
LILLLHNLMSFVTNHSAVILRSLQIAGFVALGFSVVSCSEDADDYPPEQTIAASTGELEWVKRFGGSDSESPRSIIRTSDGGLAILGFSASTDGDLSGKTTAVNDYWLLKLDREGELEWSRTYGGSKDDRGQAVIQTADGGYALTGYAMSDDGDGSRNEGFHDNWILRLDASGNILWERSFGFSGHDHSYDIVQTADGGFVFIGFMDLTAARADGYQGKGDHSTRHGVGEFWCTKVDANGELLWRFYFGGSNNDRAHAVAPAPDGGFVLAGFSESGDFDISAPNGSYDFWVIKVGPTGEMVWERNLGGSGIEIASDITAIPGGGYMVVGHSFSSDGDISLQNGASDIWVVHLSEAGAMVWERTYGGEAFDAAESICPLSDGTFLLTGTSRSVSPEMENQGENDLVALKIDAEGEVLWLTTYGGSGIDLAFDGVEGPDGSLFVVGELAEPGSSQWDVLGGTDLILLKIR